MKIAKYIFLLLLLSIIAFSVYVATQDGQFDIQKSKVIKAPRTMVFGYINDYNNWKKWSPLEEGDLKKLYIDPTQSIGLGASYSWINKNGKGEIKTVFVKENDSLAQKLNLNEEFSDIYWKLKDTVGGTKVTWGIKGKMSFISKAYAVFTDNIESVTGSMYDTGLNNLDKEIIAELNNYTIDVKGSLLRGGGYFLHQTASCNIPDLPRREGVMLDSIIVFFKKNNIPMAGAPFSIYHIYDTKNNSVTFSVAVPIAEQIITADDSDYTTGELPEFLALKTILKGDYSHSKEAWDKAYQYLTDPTNNLEEIPNGKYLEVFIKGPWDTKTPSEWITEIYIPVKEKVIVPVLPVSPPPVITTEPTVSTTPKVIE